MQALALFIERSVAGRRRGLGRGWRGWLFAFTALLLPVFVLFHPPFIHRVIVPFMQAIGAL